VLSYIKGTTCSTINLRVGLLALSVLAKRCFIGSRSTLIIKRTKRQEGGIREGRIRERGIRGGEIGEGGCKGIILCLSLFKETFRFHNATCSGIFELQLENLLWKMVLTGKCQQYLNTKQSPFPMCVIVCTV
jgi:hypothetical protein